MGLTDFLNLVHQESIAFQTSSNFFHCSELVVKRGLYKHLFTVYWFKPSEKNKRLDSRQRTFFVESCTILVAYDILS